MDQTTLLCPLCGKQIKDDETDPGMHNLEWHPYLLYKDGEWIEGVTDHLLVVARGEAPLDPKFSKYVIRTPADHTRHAALLAHHRSNIVFNTSITGYKSPPTNITYGTRKKRRP